MPDNHRFQLIGLADSGEQFDDKYTHLFIVRFHLQFHIFIRTASEERAISTCALGSQSRTIGLFDFSQKAVQSDEGGKQTVDYYLPSLSLLFCRGLEHTITNHVYTICNQIQVETSNINNL